MRFRMIANLAFAAAATLGASLSSINDGAAQTVSAVDVSAPPRLVPVRGGHLNVVVLEPRGRPSGRTLLLLHGASGNLKDLELSIGRRLAQRHRVVLVDRPGHGRSDRLGGREMASPARQADAIVEALDALRIGHVVVVGHSWSGAVATNLALDHANHISGLVTISGATHPWPGGVAWYNHVAAPPLVGDLFVAALVAPIGHLTFDRALAGVFAPKAPPPDYAERTDAKLILRPSEFRANAQDLADLKPFLTRQAPRYPSLRLPTLVITADKDQTVSPELHSRTLARQVAGARLVVIPGAGHMPHWNATDLVTSEIDAFAMRTPAQR